MVIKPYIYITIPYHTERRGRPKTSARIQGIVLQKNQHHGVLDHLEPIKESSKMVAEGISADPGHSAAGRSAS